MRWCFTGPTDLRIRFPTVSTEWKSLKTIDLMEAGRNVRLSLPP